jgi:hypothetical protein
MRCVLIVRWCGRGLANLNLAYGAECAVDAMAPTEAGFHDVFGNVWQVRRTLWQ